MTRAWTALPAIVLAVLGLAAISVATLAPRAGQPAVVVFSEDVPAADRLVRIAALGGRIVHLPSTGNAAYAAFDTVPGFATQWTSGVVAILDAAGAAGCQPLQARVPSMGAAQS